MKRIGSRAMVVGGCTLVLAISRLPAVAKSLWDGDEALLALSVLGHDSAAHLPGPPAHPLFVAAAKLLHAAGLHEFQALQAIATATAMLLFPAAYFFARELGFPFRSAVAGAALFAVLPNVWLTGGAAFADVPAVVVSMLACALLLRGRGSVSAYLTGAAIAGIAGGIRPAALLVVAVPALVATWTRLRAGWGARPGRRREGLFVTSALLLCTLIASASYVGGTQIVNVASPLSPGRPHLVDAAKLFFLLPVQDKDLMLPIAGLALLGGLEAFARRRPHALLAIATFVPLMIATWLFLDVNAVSRYAIGYLPLHAFLAAEALDFLMEPFAKGRPWLPQALFAAAAVTGVVAVGFWIWPSLRIQRKKPAPPFAAIEWVRANVPDESEVYVPAGFEPHARYLLRGRRFSVFSDSRVPGSAPSHAFLVGEREQPGAWNIVRRRERLWKAFPLRSFEASVSAVSNRPRFGSGWYQEEWEGPTWFRWMGQQASIHLPAVAHPAMLRLVFSIPDAAQRPVHVKVLFNGSLVEELAVRTRGAERRWTFRSAPTGENELQLITSTTVTPAALGINPDRRTLGLRLEAIEWMPRRR